MKLLIAFLLSSCVATKPVTKTVRTLKLTVTHIQRGTDGVEIWARGRPFLYVANCPFIPDTVKVGTILRAEPVSDTCKCSCVFNKFVKRPAKKRNGK